MRSASPRSGTASRKRWNAATAAGGTCPRWASATTSTREAGAGTPQARNRAQRPQAPVVFDFCRLAVDVCDRVISSLTLRVNYSETDQMGVVYHANYLIWFDRARTELMRETGVTYKELEQQGVYLAVSEVNLRFRAAAQRDEGAVEALARLLAAADARVFDAGLERETLGASDPFVRRQAALAAGRSGDTAAVAPLLAALRDSSAAVQAAAAFALGLL